MASHIHIGGVPVVITGVTADDIIHYDATGGPGGTPAWVNATIAGLADTMQSSYDNGPAIVLTAANPLDLTTSGVGQDGITVTDGVDTVTLRGGVVGTPSILSDLATTPTETAGQTLTLSSAPGGITVGGAAGGVGGDLNLNANDGGAGDATQASGAGGSVNITAKDAGDASGGGGGAIGGNVNITAGIGDQQVDGTITFTVGGVTTTWTANGQSSPDGVALDPAYGFAGGEGMYRPATGDLAFSSGVAAPSLVIDGVLEAAAGSEIAFHLTPTVNQTGVADSIGMLIDLDTTGSSSSGTETILTLQKDSVDAMTVNGDGNLVLAGTINTSAGTAGSPALFFATDIDTGVSSPNEDELVLSTGGVALSVMKQGLVHASADEVSYSITPTINKAAGNYTALLINATETAAPGAANKLLDIQANSASVASISSTGEVSCTNLVSTSTTASTFQGDVLIQNGADLNAGTGKFIWQRGWDSKAGTSYTVEPQADRGDRFAWNNASDVTVTFNTAAGGVQNGAVVELKHEGAGGLILASGTATVRLPPGKALRSKGQYSSLVAQYRQNTEVYVSGDLARLVRTEAGVFTVNGDDYDVLINATTTTPSTNVTVDVGVPGQVTTIVLTGTAGTLEFVAGTAAIEPEEGKTLTSVAPGASTHVTISIMYLSASVAKITGNLA